MASLGKVFAVIEVIQDKSVHITSTFQLQPFNRNWIEDKSWPVEVTWTDLAYEEQPCRILCIDSKQIFIVKYFLGS